VYLSVLKAVVILSVTLFPFNETVVEEKLFYTQSSSSIKSYAFNSLQYIYKYISGNIQHISMLFYFKCSIYVFCVYNLMCGKLASTFTH